MTDRHRGREPAETGAPGVVLPIAYGSARVACDVLWYRDMSRMVDDRAIPPLPHPFVIESR